MRVCDERVLEIEFLDIDDVGVVQDVGENLLADGVAGEVEREFLDFAEVLGVDVLCDEFIVDCSSS